MSPVHLPSLEIPEAEKQRLSEADVHSTLFEPDMATLGYPPRASSEADGEHFREQRTLAVRRLKSQRATGRYDGLYLIGNAPVMLCEVKRYDELDSQAAFDKARRQLVEYALSEDFKTPPPFLGLYCGKPLRNRLFRLKTLAEGSLLDESAYEELPERGRGSGSSRFISAASSPRRWSRPSAYARSCSTTLSGSRTTSERTPTT